MAEVDSKQVIEVLDQLRIGRGSSGKGGCWCYKADPTKIGPAYEEHTPTCYRVACFYHKISDELPYEDFMYLEEIHNPFVSTSEADDAGSSDQEEQAAAP